MFRLFVLTLIVSLISLWMWPYLAEIGKWTTKKTKELRDEFSKELNDPRRRDTMGDSSDDSSGDGSD